MRCKRNMGKLGQRPQGIIVRINCFSFDRDFIVTLKDSLKLCMVHLRSLKLQSTTSILQRSNNMPYKILYKKKVLKNCIVRSYSFSVIKKRVTRLKQVIKGNNEDD